MTDPNALPPFAKHKRYYLALKLAVILAAAAVAAKILGMW